MDFPRNKQIKGSFTENDYGKILIIANELGLKPVKQIPNKKVHSIRTPEIIKVIKGFIKLLAISQKYL